MVKAIYPGTFDPITNGHIDIIKRAAPLFDELVLGVATDVSKTTLFSSEERVAMVGEACSSLPEVTVKSFQGLLVEFARAEGATVIVRGLRAVSDFEIELQTALTNRSLYPGVETVFLMTAHEYLYLSSSTVKEIAGLGGNVGGFVPPVVEKKLRDKFGHR